MIYISGAISNDDKKIQDANCEVFHKKAKELMARGELVIDPAAITMPDGSWEKYLARDLTWIAIHKPKLYVLSNWKTSRGAKLEVEFAKFLNLEIEYESD